MVALTILSSAPSRFANAVEEALGWEGQVVKRHDLRAEKFAPCKGCFECWVDHPGTCRAKDASHEVLPDILASNVLVWVVTPEFGCWDPIAKAALDKCIGLVSPFFKTVDGETHHKPRYESYPKWAVVAVVPDDTPEEERELFRRLVARNVLNLQSNEPWVGFVSPLESRQSIVDKVRAGVSQLTARDEPFMAHEEPLPPRKDAEGLPALHRPRRALLWIGSTRAPGESTSESLGNHLLGHLSGMGWETDTIRTTKTIKFERGVNERFTKALDWADLVIVSAPVYVDCLPALVLQGLRPFVEAGKRATGPKAVLPIINCGFPEPNHTRLALEILGRAARAGGYRWAGHLAMGGGQAVHGTPVEEVAGMLHKQVDALEQAAAALDEGGPVPPFATERFKTLPIGPGLYRVSGTVGWLREALANQALFKLRARPHDPKASR